MIAARSSVPTCSVQLLEQAELCRPQQHAHAQPLSSLHPHTVGTYYTFTLHPSCSPSQVTPNRLPVPPMLVNGAVGTATSAGWCARGGGGVNGVTVPGAEVGAAEGTGMVVVVLTTGAEAGLAAVGAVLGAGVGVVSALTAVLSVGTGAFVVAVLTSAVAGGVLGAGVSASSPGGLLVVAVSSSGAEVMATVPWRLASFSTLPHLSSSWTVWLLGSAMLASLQSTASSPSPSLTVVRVRVFWLSAGASLLMGLVDDVVRTPPSSSSPSASSLREAAL